MTAVSPQRKTAIRDKLSNEIERLQHHKAQIAHWQDEANATQQTILELMEELGVKSFSYKDDEGFGIKTTKVQAETIVIDEPRLKKTIGASMWNKVTSRVLDKDKLESAVAEGRVDETDVAMCADTKKRKPYVKITRSLPTKGDRAEAEPSKPVPLSERKGRRRGFTADS